MWFPCLLLLVFASNTLCRDPFKQPFASGSIWNLPIGKNAVYTYANIPPSNQQGGMNPDQDILILTPKAPLINFGYNSAGWNKHQSRCTVQGKTVISGPVPKQFVIPGNNGALGGTPNSAAAILQADNHTIVQGQPVARCKAGGPATCKYPFPSVDLYGNGTRGAHGGSGLSSIGGTIRLGELVPGGAMRHALKLEFNGATTYWKGRTNRFRWPAVNADNGGGYGGNNPNVKPGSLLALRNTSLDLKTTPAKMVAWTLYNYGGYIVDNAAWGVNQFCVEFSPDGYVADEFKKVWGFPMTSGNEHSAFESDINLIVTNLYVVNNWDEKLWEEVYQSNGKQGAGGGAPLQPWAPPIRK